MIASFGASFAFRQRPQSAAYRPFIGRTSKGAQGRKFALAGVERSRKTGDGGSKGKDRDGAPPGRR
jgi:hypothetical protein